MQLIELSEADKTQYNNFVAANQSGSFLQSWEWGEWQQALGRTVYRFKIQEGDLENNDNIRGVLQLIKMPLPFGKHYLYAPYGPMLAGGENFQFPISNFQKIFNELISKLSDAVFIRVEPKANFQFFHLGQGFGGQAIFNFQMRKARNIQPGKTLIIDLFKTPDELLADMHHKTRYNIRLAQKHNVEIQDEFVLTVGKGLYTKEAVELIADTSKRQGFKDQGREYFEKLVDFFVLKNKNSAFGEKINSGLSAEALAKADALNNHRSDFKLHIYKALYRKQLLASAIIIDFGTTRTYLFGGSSDEHKNIMAPHLLHWQAMLDAKALGLLYYDFWGIETAAGNTPGFVRFKLGFSASETSIRQYAGAYDLIFKSFAYKIYSLLRKINRLFSR